MHLKGTDTLATLPGASPKIPATRPRGPVAAMWLFCLLAAPAIAAFELRYYLRALEFHDLPWTAAATLFWALSAKSLLLLTPGLVLAATLSRLSRPRTAWTLFALASLFICTWLLTDLQAQRQAGTHLSDLLALAFFPNAGQVAGGTRPIVLQALLTLIPTILGSLALMAACARLTPPIPARRQILTYTLATLGVIPAQLWFPNPKSLQRLYASLPVSIDFLATGTLVGDTVSFNLPLQRILLPTLNRIGDPIAPRPADGRKFIDTPDRPHVVIVCCDSLRADALTPERMPRLYALAQKGLWLRHHFAQTNVSHFGIFTILYGRTAASYDTTLDAHVPPQLTLTLGQAGYHRTYQSPMQYLGWARMSEYINPQAFDESLITTCSFDVGDRVILNRVTHMLAPGASPGPQFILAFLSSTHHPYVYPKEYETHLPVPDTDTLGWRRDRFGDRDGVMNRYLNSLKFTDDIIADFIAALDLTKTIVVVTGDHGEGLWQDGSLTHGTRASELQTRVPCFLLGANVPTKTIDRWTGHTDLAPTLLHAVARRHLDIYHFEGRDLLDDTRDPGPDQVTQCIGYARSQDVTIDVFTPDGRLRLRVNRRTPGIEALGTIDMLGNVDAFQLPPPSQVRTWAKRIERELWKLRK